MERARFILRALKLGASPGWGLLRQLLSIAALVAVVAGLQVVGLPLVATVVLGLVLLFGVVVEGSFRLWTVAQEELNAATQAAQLPRPDGRQDLAPNISDALNAQLRRGRRLRTTARFSSDGTAGPLEMWEEEVAMLLEDRGRHDLAARFEAGAPADKGRALISGPWATRSRIDRKLRLLGEFIDAEHSET